MLGGQLARETDARVVCMVIHGSTFYNLYYASFLKQIPLEICLFSRRTLWRFLVASMLRSPWARPVVYLPHLSPYLVKPKELALLKRLHRLGFVRFYDDGIGSMSMQTMIWQKKYITCEPGDLMSWDYRFLRAKKNRSNMLSIVQAYDFFGSHLQGQPAQQQDSDSPPLAVVPRAAARALIISSKWIHWSSVLAMIGDDNLSTSTYLPHCVSHKNNQHLLETAAPWPYDLPPELVLPDILNDFQTIFFGVTSTVPFVIEAMLSMSLPIRPLFVVAIDFQLAEFPGEAEDFTEKIRYYQRHHQLRLQVVARQASPQPSAS
jgi:hypothetical protein